MPPLVSSHFPADFLKQLQTFREDRFLCDVRLIADDRIEFPAHRLVLAASSSYFQKLFQKKRDDQDVTTIQLKNCNSECVTVVLQFLYSGELHLRDCDPGKVLNMAKACQIDALETMLASYNTTPGAKVKSEQPGENEVTGVNSSDNKSALKTTSSQNKRAAKNGTLQQQQQDEALMVTNLHFQALKQPNADFLRKFCQVHSLLGCQCNCPDEMLTTINPAALQFLFSQAPALFNGAGAMNPYGGPPPPKMARSSAPASTPAAAAPSAPQTKAPAGGGSNAKSDNNSKTSNISVKVTNGVNGESATESDCTPSPVKDVEFENGQIPVDDRDGWCRNKKYIKKTLNGGYQCTICKKTYGRYNSVSYHVTIYHRNPPIQCDQPGCTFSTREARYIHFHKYYRHDVALPTNIDLESRRCPFCKHVAKSPAMLEKHINRHMPGSLRTSAAGAAAATGKVYQCELCKKDFSSKPQLTQHMAVHKGEKVPALLTCDQCSYRGKTVTSLEQHKVFKHSGAGGLWCSKYQCEICHYTTPSESKLIAHKNQVHNKGSTLTDDGGRHGAGDDHATTSSGDHSDSCPSGAEDDVGTIPTDSPDVSYSMVSVEPAISRTASLDDFAERLGNGGRSIASKTGSLSDISV